MPEGDAWIIEGVDDPINFGLNACAGLPAERQKAWMRFEELREGGWNPSARLDEMDEDGIWAAFLYPTPRLSQGVVANKDPKLQVEMVRAYNDWLSEYANRDPDRSSGSPCCRYVGSGRLSPNLSARRRCRECGRGHAVLSTRDNRNRCR